MYSGELLEYLSSWSKLGNIVRVRAGPFFEAGMCLHPDTAKIGLGSGQK